MSAYDWTGVLTDPAAATRYLGPAPDLNAHTLAYVHLDERDTGVTLGFDLDALPPRPLPEWTEKGLNAFEFTITFTGVTGLRMRGWHTTRDKAVSVTPGAGRGIDVVVSAPEEHLSFSAASAHLASARAYLASHIA